MLKVSLKKSLTFYSVLYVYYLDIDECQSGSTCGFGVSCVNLPGSYKCGCPPGAVSDPANPGQCLAVKQCRADGDCPGNAFCSPDGACACPEPNQGPNCESKLCLVLVS